MKKGKLISLLLIILIITIVASACGQQAQENAIEDTEEFVDTGILVVDSSPSGADVYVNGKIEGQTPVTLYNLPVGGYNVKVAKEGYKEFEKNAVVKVGASEEIDARLETIAGEDDREICPAVCSTVYVLSDKCSVNECGSGCGGDGAETFNSLEECRTNLPQGEDTIKLDSFAMYHDFENMIFSVSRDGNSDLFTRKYNDYVDVTAMPPAKIMVIGKPLDSVKKVDCINTQGAIAQLKQGQTLCVITIEGSYFALGLKSIDEIEYAELN